MKRTFLFIVTNLAIMLVLTVTYHLVMAFLGPDAAGALAADGIALQPLVVFSLVFGMGGAFVSLLLSKPMAKWSTGAQTIDGAEGETEAWLVRTVEKLARGAGVSMPEVAIYPGAPNAFATGAFRNHALVAVSDGILRSMSRDELEAVLGHEMSHVSNGDMVTLALVQGVLNACVLLLSRVIAAIVENSLNGRERRRGPSGVYMLVYYLLQSVLGVLASLIVCAYSRRREFAADAGSARLLGTPVPMISALRRLGGLETSPLPESLKAFGISGRRASLFATHPSIQDRIDALSRGFTGC